MSWKVNFVYFQVLYSIFIFAKVEFHVIWTPIAHILCHGIVCTYMVTTLLGNVLAYEVVKEIWEIETISWNYLRHNFLEYIRVNIWYLNAYLHVNEFQKITHEIPCIY